MFVLGFFYSLGGKHLWHQLCNVSCYLKSMSLLLYCLVCIAFPLSSFAFDCDIVKKSFRYYYCEIKPNPTFFDINLMHWQRQQQLVQIDQTQTLPTKCCSWTFFRCQSHPQWWMQKVKIIFFSVACLTDVSRQSPKQGSRLYPANFWCYCIKAQQIKLCWSCWALMQLTHTCSRIQFLFLLSLITQAKCSAVFGYLFYKNELIAFQVICTFLTNF